MVSNPIRMVLDRQRSRVVFEALVAAGHESDALEVLRATSCAHEAPAQLKRREALEGLADRLGVRVAPAAVIECIPAQ